jgi:hypothetical protein
MFGRFPSAGAVLLVLQSTDAGVAFNDGLLMQESNLFFKALEKVKEYAQKSGHLPTIISENVQGRRFRRWDEVQVRCSRGLQEACVYKLIFCAAAAEVDAALSQGGGRRSAGSRVRRCRMEAGHV